MLCNENTELECRNVSQIWRRHCDDRAIFRQCYYIK